VRVHSEGLVGDEQADRRYHGGPDKAILAYCREHYDLWRAELKWLDFGPGVLGENFEISGQSEAEVCIGDSYRAGDLILQVSQPRQPCWKPARLHSYPKLTRLMAKQSRTGWYLRVLQQGMVEAPCPIELIERPHPEWTLERANRLLYHNAEGFQARLELAALPELSEAWQEMLSTPA
jgi:MOSC domain-containing protein YiiM